MKRLWALLVLVVVAVLAWDRFVAGPLDTLGSGDSTTAIDVAVADRSSATASELPAGAVAPRAAETRTATTGALRVQAIATAADGREHPLAGLLVIAWPGSGDSEPTDASSRRATTDERGEAVFDDLATGPCTVVAPAIEGEPQRAAIVADAATVVALRVAAAFAVTGDVVDTNGRPVAGADVWLVRAGDPSELAVRRAGRTAGDGSFAIVAVDMREARRIAASHAEVGESRARFVAAGSSPIHLVLEPAPASLTGIVRDARGTVVADAVVVVHFGDETPQRLRDGTLVAGRNVHVARSDAAGDFAFARLPVGRATVAASKEPHGVAVREVDLASAVPARIELSLPEGAVIFGIARRKNGEPLRATVDLLPARGVDGALASARTRPDGSYRLPVVPHRAAVVALKLGQQTLADRVFASLDAGWQRCDFEVDDAGTTTGTLTTASGRALAGWMVRFVFGSGATATARTDARGGFTIAAQEGGTVRAMALPPGSETAALVVDGVQPGQHLELRVPEAALPRALLRGRVSLANGRPVAVDLRLRNATTQHRLRSGDDGAFEFAGLVAASWTLECMRSGVATALATGVAIGENEVKDLGTVALPATGRVAVELVDAVGRPWSGSVVGFELADGNGKEVPAAHVQVGDRPGLEAPCGRYRLRVIATDIRCDGAEVMIEADRTTAVRLLLQIGRTLRLRWPADVEPGRGAAMPLSVTVRDARGEVLVQTTVGRADARIGDRAAWQFAHVFAFGPHVVEASTADGRHGTARLDVAESLDAPTTLDLEFDR